MEFFEVINNRHSYRGPFDPDKKVSREDLTKIVSAGCAAPSGKNAQTTLFVAVDDPATVTKLRSIHSVQPAWGSAQAYIACIIAQSPDPVYEGFSFEIEDCAAAVENMMLAITALGYASVWVDGALRLAGKARAIADILGVDNNTQIIRVMLPIGVPAQPVSGPEKKSIGERVKFI